METVVIDGQIVMQGREVLTLDEEDILEDIRRRHRTVSDRARFTIGPRWPVL